MKKYLFFIAFCFLSGCYISVPAQNNSFGLPMESTYVINKACAIRTYNGNTQYIMMPTEYNNYPSNGSVSLIIMDDNLNVTKRKLSSGTAGLVVNDIVIGSANEIIFSGLQNNEAVIGQISAAGNSLSWLRKDTYSTGYTAMAEATINNTSKSVAIKSKNNFRSATCLHTNGNFATPTSRLHIDTVVNKDIAVSLGAGWTTSYAVTIGRKDASTMAVFAWKLNMSQAGKAFVSLPAYWKWHEGGGTITNIGPDEYIAAIDVRCDSAYRDGVLLIKMKVKTTVTILESKIIVFPAPKVIVHDIHFIDEPLEGDVSVNILGHFVNTSDVTIPTNTGCPFCIKIDTALTVYHTMQYGSTWDTSYMRKNYQLNKGVYNNSIQIFATTGSYNGDSNNLTGGLYFVQNQIGDSWCDDALCEEQMYLPCIPVALTTNTMGTWQSDNMSYNIVGAQISSPISNNYENLCVRKMPFRQKNINKSQEGNLFKVHSSNGTLQLFDLQHQCVFSIFDMKGRLVVKGQTDGYIDIHTLKKGIYIIRVRDENGDWYSEKFIR